MSTIMGCLFLIIFGNSISVLSKEKSHKGIQAGTLFTICILYVFYCLNLLAIGRLILWTIGLGTTLYILYHKNTRAEFLKKILSPCSVVLLFLAILIYIYTKEYSAILWDELRLWEIVPKAMHYSEALQLGDKAYVAREMQSYFPGMPLFVYFLTSFTIAFHENEIFLGYAVFAYILLCGLWDVSWKNFVRITVTSSVAILLPCVFTSHGGDFGYFYASLFVDIPLGIIAGFVFAEVALSDGKSESACTRIRLIMSLAVLTILKDSGILFALCAMLCYIPGHIRANKKWYFVAIFLLPFLFRCLWTFELTITDVKNHIPF